MRKVLVSGDESFTYDSAKTVKQDKINELYDYITAFSEKNTPRHSDLSYDENDPLGKIEANFENAAFVGNVMATVIEIASVSMLSGVLVDDEEYLDGLKRYGDQDIRLILDKEHGWIEPVPSHAVMEGDADGGSDHEQSGTELA